MFVSSNSSRCTISDPSFNNQEYHFWLCRRWTCFSGYSWNIFIFSVLRSNLCIDWCIYCNDLRNDYGRYCYIWSDLCHCCYSIRTRYEGKREGRNKNFFGLVFYLLFRDTYEGGNCERLSANDTCMVENMCSFRNFEAWMTMIHFTMGEFDVSHHFPSYSDLFS